MEKLTINGIRQGSLIEADGKRLVFQREVGDGSLLLADVVTGAPHRVEDMETGLFQLASVAWLETMLREGKLRLLDELVTVDPDRRQIQAELDHEEILAKDPYAKARFRLFRALGEMGVNASDPDLSSKISEIWKGELADEFGDRPETSTVRSWFGRGDPLDVALIDMMSRSGRVPRAQRLDPEVLEIVNEDAHWFYASRGRKQRDVRAKVAVRIRDRNVERAADGLPPLDRPSRETIRRRINEICCRELYAQKWGEAAARAKWDGAGHGLKAMKILAIGLMDDTVIDGVVVFDVLRGVPAGRPWLVVLMDVYSRCVVGWCISFVPPSVHTAAECIRRANRPKVVRRDRGERYPVLSCINGRFAEIITDNGSNYVSPAFGDVLADIGTALRLAPVRSPRHKAIVERFFYTLKTWLLEKLPGSTLEPALIRKFDLNPEADACITLTELELLMDEFLYVYHISVHAGLAAQPARVWQRSMENHGRDVIADERKLAILTGVAVFNRRLTRQGLRFMGLVYRHEERVAELLDDLAGIEPARSQLADTSVATVKIKYDPQNLGEIHVWNRIAGRYVTLPCAMDRYATGLSLWQHQQVQAWAKRENIEFNTEDERLQAQHDLIELILELAPGMAARERRAVARMLGTTAMPQPGDRAVLVASEPRHDGMGPVIEHGTAADSRTDGELEPSRPANASEPQTHTPDDDPRAHGAPEDLVTDEPEPLLFDSPDDEDRKWEDYA